MAATFSAEDHRFMARALQLAARGLCSTRPNPRVGCLIVRDGRIVGEGWHARAGEPHAEVHALAQAGGQARGATCYVTLEPCCHAGRTPPCTEALLQAGIAEVVAAMVDPNPRVGGGGLQGLKQAGVDVRSGLMAAEALALNVGFCQRMRSGRPWVRAKLGVSLDGRIAMASGESKWITGEAARADVQRWRARSGAILTGVNTVLADDPALTVRDPALAAALPAQPLRVVIDSRLRSPPSARVRTGAGPCLLIGASDGEGHTADGTIEHCAGHDGRVDLSAALQLLGRREINEVLVEAGPTLTGALMQHGLIDELILYIAPRLLGDDALPMIRLPGLAMLGAAPTMQRSELRVVGDDLCLVLRPINNSDSAS
jgi:diaminohydroxyphosphoribosylaminopyrimidine deaminase / 5-amino-6-(5-phosphoribosylamino)uracil reductase